MKKICSLRLALVSAALGFVLAACGGGGGTPPPTLVSITVTPAGASLAKGLTQQFRAMGALSDGTQQDLSHSVAWASSNPPAVTIDPAAGLATAVGVGSSKISATLAAGRSVNHGSSAVTGFVSLAVTPATVTKIALTPAAPALELGANQSFVATGTLTDGTTQDLTQVATWASSDAAVLRINNTAGRVGVGNTRGPGTATVTATMGPVTGTTLATVMRRTPKFLYSASADLTTVSAFRVDPATGALTGLGTPYGVGYFPTSVVATHDSKFLYVTVFTNNQVVGFAIQPDGSLVPTPGSPLAVAGAPFWLTADPSGNFVYASTQGAGITVLAVDPATGAPSIASSVATGGAPQDAALTPDGAYFYQTLSAMDQVAGFAIDRNSGTLSALVPPGPTTATYPRGIAIDPSGKFLYVTIETSWIGPSTAVDAYSIDAASGALTRIPGAPFTAGANPIAAVCDPSGRFLYVSDADAQTISAFSIDPDSGVLMEIAGSPFAVAGGPGTGNLTVDPSGQYLYVATTGSSSPGILGFTINQATGALSPNPSASGAAGDVWSITITH
jgi:6-phosphogluconolactonase (cycloisomerase 2 family)